ncbi:MAG: YHS domain-containing protein [Chitinophagales bacterium]
MKNLLFLAVMVGATLASCVNPDEKRLSTAPSPEDKTVKMNVALAVDKDLVCGMKVTPASLKDTFTYEGKVYGFCNEGCKAEFAQDPKKYLAAQ